MMNDRAPNTHNNIKYVLMCTDLRRLIQVLLTIRELCQHIKFVILQYIGALKKDTKTHKM